MSMCRCCISALMHGERNTCWLRWYHANAWCRFMLNEIQISCWRSPQSTHTRPRFNQIYNSFINAIHSNPHLNWLNAKCILCKYCICSVWRTHPLIKILITLNVTVQWRWAAAAQHTWIASPYLHAHIFHVRLAAATDECNESTS